MGAVEFVRCAEIWGGVGSNDTDVCTSGVTASLYAAAHGGGRGGDIYYFSVCGYDQLTRIAIADVSGHGPTVSAVSEWLYEELAAHMNALEGDRILTTLNHAACARGLEALTTAAVIGFYRGNSHLYFAYAGHPPLYLRRAGAHAWERLALVERGSTANLPLGVLDETDYDQGASQLAPGDRLCLYTDGVLEARDARGERFGAARLEAALAAAGGEGPTTTKRAVVDALRAHTGGGFPHDDVTLMVLEAI
jgi:sigma-B regulation protein RsbU (phosphoserine phosphatase)